VAIRNEGWLEGLVRYKKIALLSDEASFYTLYTVQ